MISYIVYLPFSVIILFHAPTSLPLIRMFTAFSMCLRAFFSSVVPFLPSLFCSFIIQMCEWEREKTDFLIRSSSCSFRSDSISFWVQLYRYSFCWHQSEIENVQHSLIPMQRSKWEKKEQKRFVHSLCIHAICLWNPKIEMEKQNQRIWAMLMRLPYTYCCCCCLSIPLTSIGLGFCHSRAIRCVCVCVDKCMICLCYCSMLRHVWICFGFIFIFLGGMLLLLRQPCTISFMIKIIFSDYHSFGSQMEWCTFIHVCNHLHTQRNAIASSSSSSISISGDCVECKHCTSRMCAQKKCILLFCCFAFFRPLSSSSHSLSLFLSVWLPGRLRAIEFLQLIFCPLSRRIPLLPPDKNANLHTIQ